MPRLTDFASVFKKLKELSPRIHCITNYVTANDCANVLLACNASPIMADDVCEAAQITSLSQALTINTGTMHEHTLPAMLESGRQANLEGKPVILDPVGAGSSQFRTETALTLLENIRFSAVRANISEIKALLNGQLACGGVDACPGDEINRDNLQQSIMLINEFSKKYNTVTAVTGKYDIVSDGNSCCIIKNGHPLMSRVTGTGCMLSAFCAAMCAANPEDIFSAVIVAVCGFGICGELAWSEGIGSGTYRTRLIDEIYHLTWDKIKEKAKYEYFTP